MSDAKPRGRDPRLPSLLPAWLRGWLVAALLLAAFLLANTAYLLVNRLAEAAQWRWLTGGELFLPRTFQVLLLGHSAAGLLLALLMAAFAAGHLPRVWRRRHRASVLSGSVYVLLGLALAISGMFILTAAASRAHRWVWWLHVACAAAVPVAYGLHRRVSYVRPRPGALRRFAMTTVGGAVLLLGIHVATVRPWGASVTNEAVSEGAGEGPVQAPRSRMWRAGEAEEAEAAGEGFRPAADVPTSSPFFPSRVTTSSGGFTSGWALTGGDLPAQDSVRAELARAGFMSGATVGAVTCARCHPDVVAQWSASAHRFASFDNPFYVAAIDLLRRTAETNPWIDAYLSRFGTESVRPGHVASQFCAGCHDPVLLLSGRMLRPIERASPEAQAGLTCLSCHRIDRLEAPEGNGGYRLADERADPYLFAGAHAGGLRAWIHDAALKARPAVHKRRMMTPDFQRSEFCGSCHKVSLSEPINGYRWLRAQDEYDNWHDSGISRNAARTFYLPDRRRVCQDCHMPPEAAPLGDVAADGGTVRSHRFIAANTALPFLRGDKATLRRIEAFLRDEKLSVDIFAVRLEGGGSIPIPAERTLSVMPGEGVQLEVVVRNRGVGHTFPGGTNDSNQGWLEVTVSDVGKGSAADTAGGSDGVGVRTLARSGGLDEGGHLDPMAHVFAALLVDGSGERIVRRNGQDIRTAAFRNVIGPGSADIAHYAFRIPGALAGHRLRVRVRLLWRKFHRPFSEFAFRSHPEGFRGFPEAPGLPVTEIAADGVMLEVTAPGSARRGLLPAKRHDARVGSVAQVGAREGPAAQLRIPEWERFNDYGIGLLREGDTRGAAWAFSEVERLAPTRTDGPLNLARTAVRDGNLEAAASALRRAEALRPGDPRTAWVWGITRQADGRYGEAAAAYRRVLETFPEDRAAWRNLGRTLYLDERYEEAVKALDHALTIDPEDRMAHYHRMLALRALGKETEARTASAAYAYYQVDESAAQLAREYRLRHPGANLMAQQIRIHRLVLEASPPRPYPNGSR